MENKILSQLMILSFAVAGLFLVGNNVLAGDPTVIIDESDHEGGGGITCHQYAEPGRLNVCWRKYADWGWRPITDWCYFTGYMADKCFI